MLDEKIRLLLVDDDESFVSVLSQQLQEEYGYDTTIATSAKEAIEKIRSSRRSFDLILLDYMMPEMTGINFLQWLVEQKVRTPVVMLTAAGSEQVAVEAMKLGAYDYVRKELIDIPHLDILIRATHERHLYRVDREMEEERLREIQLNKEATERARDVINAITPTISSALAGMSLALETRGEEILQKLPPSERREVKMLFDELSRYEKMLVASTKGLMGLFQIVYTHYTGMPVIENIRSEFEAEVRGVRETSESGRR
jgi:DNA-binding response OmpR family regulator